MNVVIWSRVSSREQREGYSIDAQLRANRDAPVQPHPEKANTVRRIFELYSTGSHIFKSLADQLDQEGHTFRKSQPRFHRTALSYILKNRFYIGVLRRNGQVFEAKKRSSELAAMQDRLLNAYLVGTVDEATYQTKSNEFKGEAARVEEAMGGLGDLSPARRELAVAVFDWSQRATDFWQRSTDAARGRIFNAVYLNRA